MPIIGLEKNGIVNMSQYLKSKEAKKGWDAMRSNFRTDNEEKKEEGPGLWSRIKSLFSGPNAAEAATGFAERMKKASEAKKDKK